MGREVPQCPPQGLVTLQSPPLVLQYTWSGSLTHVHNVFLNDHGRDSNMVSLLSSTIIAGTRSLRTMSYLSFLCLTWIMIPTYVISKVYCFLTGSCARSSTLSLRPLYPLFFKYPVRQDQQITWCSSRKRLPDFALLTFSPSIYCTIAFPVLAFTFKIPLNFQDSTL